MSDCQTLQPEEGETNDIDFISTRKETSAKTQQKESFL